MSKVVRVGTSNGLHRSIVVSNVLVSVRWNYSSSRSMAHWSVQLVREQHGQRVDPRLSIDRFDDRLGREMHSFDSVQKTLESTTDS